MAATVELRTGADGAGRPELDADALARLCRCYDLILARAARRRRALAAQQVEAERIEVPREATT